VLYNPNSELTPCMAKPLFGSVRYNSSIPAEARFTQIFGDFCMPESVFYLVKCNSGTNEKSTPTLLTDDEANFDIRPLPYGGEGFELVVDAGEQGLWILDFAAPLQAYFEEGVYANAERYPFNCLNVPGVELITPEGGFLQPKGEFEVLEFATKSDKVERLSINFKLKNSNGECLEGAFRYKSKVPFDLENPYTSDEE